MQRSEHFEIVINGKECIVIIEPGEEDYEVLLDGRYMGRLWKRKAGHWLCKHLESGSQYGGHTRREAAINMIFTQLKMEQ